MRFLHLIFLAILLAPFAACQHPSRASREARIFYDAGNYPAAARIMAPEIAKKDEDFVLNNCRFGSCALAAGDLAGAENAFMAAYEVINGYGTNNGGRTMGATLVFEGVKVWKGEPFERAMAHYYLGMIFLIKGDYENARAAFQNSVFKLREYAKKDDLKHYQDAESNFALGYFGMGFCWLRMGRGDLAQANFEIAARINPPLATVIKQLENPAVNTLLFIDAGRGPQKSPRGWYNEESAFGPTPAEVGPIARVELFLDGKLAAGGPQYASVDTLAMAQEQRWQDIDTIRKTKAVVGTGLMVAGAGVTAYGADRRDTGTALAGVGAMALGAALAASSQADIRYWELLPRTVYIVPVILPPGQHELMVRAAGSASNPLRVTITPDKKDHIYYFRLR